MVQSRSPKVLSSGVASDPKDSHFFLMRKGLFQEPICDN